MPIGAIPTSTRQHVGRSRGKRWRVAGCFDGDDQTGIVPLQMIAGSEKVRAAIMSRIGETYRVDVWTTAVEDSVDVVPAAELMPEYSPL